MTGYSIPRRAKVIIADAQTFEAVTGRSALRHPIHRRRVIGLVCELLQFLTIQAVPLYLSGIANLLQDRVGDVALAISLKQNANDRRRIDSLRTVLRDADSPIFICQLVTWLFTPSRHIDVVLGDLIEGYNSHVIKYGRESARKWCQRQTAREAWSRIGSLFGIVGGFRQLIHSLLNHLR
ncbi:MAG TPA: hypothetical protein VF865_05325 [Acidobacteriaceae bacterium]